MGPFVFAAEESVDAALGRLVQDTLARNRKDVYHQVQEIVDRIVLREVLQHVKGSQVEAADVLGISRTTLRAKLHRLGLAALRGKDVGSHCLGIPSTASGGEGTWRGDKVTR
jgi:two-component system nitrogen regulation response regulator GlnG